MSNGVRQDGKWEQAIPRTQDALEFLQATAAAVATSRTIEDGVRTKGIAAAKRLSAELAQFGFAEAAQLAHDIVRTLDHAGLPQPERLEQQVGALRSSLASALEE